MPAIGVLTPDNTMDTVAPAETAAVAVVMAVVASTVDATVVVPNPDPSAAAVGVSPMLLLTVIVSPIAI